MSISVLAAAALSLAISSPGGYFPGLDRPAAGPVEVASAPGPVFLIVVDALRPDRLDAYGFERETAPALKRLADEGFIFTNFFANGNWTRPSTATILTGLLPHEHGVEGQQDRLPPELVSFPELLAQRG
ncbi:MAG: sulfatase-like hydrolase/transferase, partial [Myxococcota bacterium]|nr:sulfatase-like hydrolase/transferase [Myxococcota bacterium]